MNDPKILREIIKEREKKEPARFIEIDDDLPVELVELLIATKTRVVDSLFKKMDPSKRYIEEHAHTVYFHCKNCGETFRTKKLNYIETKAFLYDLKHKNVLCSDCYNRLQNEQEIKRQEQIKKDQEKSKTNTIFYIQEYLDPTKPNWGSEITYRDRWGAIDTYGKILDTNAIKDHIINMKYKDFLQTRYWKTISQKVLYRYNYKCSLCGKSENLVAHHTTYENHGEEHRFWKNDLICLCNRCHKKVHDIKDKEGK